MSFDLGIRSILDFYRMVKCIVQSNLLNSSCTLDQSVQSKSPNNVKRQVSTVVKKSTKAELLCIVDWCVNTKRFFNLSSQLLIVRKSYTSMNFMKIIIFSIKFYQKICNSIYLHKVLAKIQIHKEQSTSRNSFVFNISLILFKLLLFLNKPKTWL